MTADLTIISGPGGCEDEIAAITEAAFTEAYGSGAGEAALIRKLRADGDAIVELTALGPEGVLGHVMFSRLMVSPAGLIIAALAPVCARIGWQGKGVGSTLIREGIVRLKKSGVDAVAVLGDPDYYARFGFSLEDARLLESPYSGPHFQALALHDGALTGGSWKLQYPRAFAAV